jgi:glucose/mannose-6-phosphate isomerase
MLETIQSFPDQIRAAWTLIKTIEMDVPAADDIENVVILGMGGSAIGGDLVAALISAECKRALLVQRDYDLPAWVGAATLVIGSSYSGNTEETLSAWHQAGKRGARRVAITTGGSLARSAAESGDPAILFDFEAQPRAALGYSFTLLYGLLARIGLIASPADRLAAAVRDLVAGNPEKAKSTQTLTRHLADGIPIILAAEHLGPVARRWTTQINENSKSWAFWNEYPELDHNLIVGLGLPSWVNESNGLRVVHLHSTHYATQVQRRIEITAELMRNAGIPVIDYAPDKKTSRLGEVLQTVWQGDYLSFELAKRYKVDPTPVPEIETLKTRLANPT